MTLMKISFIFDLLGLFGFGCAIAGVYLLWGLPIALMVGGISTLALTIAKRWGE
jgi:hypothetical protein